MKQKLLFLILLFVITGMTFSQSRITEIEQKIQSLENDVPALNNAIDISVNNISIQDFVRAVAQNSTVNINIDANLKINVSNDFTRVKVKDILLFLCKEYNLEIEIIGTIISLKKAEEPIAPPKALAIKVPQIEYDNANDLLSIDAFNDTLRVVAKIISDKTGKNVVIAPGLSENIVSSYITKMPFESVMDKFSFANNLAIEKTADNFYLLRKAVETPPAANIGTSSVAERNTQTKGIPEAVFDYEIKGKYIVVHAENIPIYDLAKTISDTLKVNYMLLSDIEGTTTIHCDSIDYEHFIAKLLDGTNYTFLTQNNIYLIGESKNVSLTNTEIYYFQFRSVDKIKDFIPAELVKDVKIIEFVENNALIMTGNSIGLTKLKDFIRQIDMPVPVVLIEVIILDVTNGFKFSTGLQAGLSNNPENMAPGISTGGIYPGVDINLSTKAINSAISGVNGLSWVNLGKVSPNFSLKLQLMEDKNIAKIKSTPMLSTLNGHEASLSSGETRYYKEERSDLIGTQNPTLTSSASWKPLNADLSINIKPIVSGDGHITLFIQVQQSEFTSRASSDSDSPYNSVKRDFKSSIRVKDQEMILLGGLERNVSEKNNSGLPFLARIPGLNWILGNRTRSKTESKLTVFIKPTVIY